MISWGKWAPLKLIAIVALLLCSMGWREDHTTNRFKRKLATEPGVLLDRLDAREACDREPGHPAVQPVIAPGARIRRHHLHAGLAQLVGPVARAGADFHDGGVRGQHLDGRLIQDGKPIMLEIEFAQAPGLGRVRRGLPGPQGPVAPLGEKLPGQGHGDVPSIRSAAIVSADARAHVVRGHEAQSLSEKVTVSLRDASPSVESWRF